MAHIKHYPHTLHHNSTPLPQLSLQMVFEYFRSWLCARMCVCMCARMCVCMCAWMCVWSMVCVWGVVCVVGGVWCVECGVVECVECGVCGMCACVCMCVECACGVCVWSVCGVCVECACVCDVRACVCDVHACVCMCSVCDVCRVMAYGACLSAIMCMCINIKYNIFAQYLVVQKKTLKTGWNNKCKQYDTILDVWSHSQRSTFADEFFTINILSCWKLP